EPLAAFIGDHGGEVRPDNRATGLITEGDAVKGVYVSDGADEYAIEADAVILATGGYSDNQEMFESYSRIPFDRVYGWGIPGRNGDGITWAEQ
ncbi:FAD-binding protein, partial [Staphylococcus aureus]